MKAAPSISQDILQQTEDMIRTMDLGAIEEGSEDDDSLSDKKSYHKISKPNSIFSPSDVAQAFSHFSYWATGRKRLICDLQGVYDEKLNVLMLSDPVIHYYNRSDESRRYVHGMTDKGSKGMVMFFATHECSRLCRMVTNGFKKFHEIGKTRRAVAHTEMKFTNSS